MPDYEDRVTGIAYPSTATNSFGYNAFDTRVSKSDSAGTFTFLRDGVGVTDPVLSDGSSSFTPGVSQRSGATSTFQAMDRLGTFRVETNASQSVTGTRTYDAFGNPTATTGTPATPFGFAGAWGYQQDPDSGLMLLGHRYYDSSTGRFLTRDPAKDGRNWYGYVDANPLWAVDPSGLGWKRVVGGILGGIAGGLLSGGNPFAIAAGVAVGSTIGDAGDQVDEGHDVDWGRAGTHGVTDGAIGLASGYALSWIAKALLPVEEGAGGLINGVHYTNEKFAEQILKEEVIRPGRGGNVWAWPRPVPKAINFFAGGRGGETISISVPASQVRQGWWGQLIIKGMVTLK